MHYAEVRLPVEHLTAVKFGSSPNTHLSIKVYYTLGGEGLFGTGKKPRGFYVSVTPITIKDGMVGFGLLSGKSWLVAEAKRNNSKTGEALAKQVRTELEHRYGGSWELVEQVLATDALKLTGPDTRNPLKLWEKLGNVPVNDDSDLQEPFLHFPKGTNNETVWKWFEETFKGFSVAKAMGCR